jgi:hypothetical protein
VELVPRARADVHLRELQPKDLALRHKHLAAVQGAQRRAPLGGEPVSGDVARAQVLDVRLEPILPTRKGKGSEISVRVVAGEDLVAKPKSPKKRPYISCFGLGHISQHLHILFLFFLIIMTCDSTYTLTSVRTYGLHYATVFVHKEVEKTDEQNKTLVTNT